MNDILWSAFFISLLLAYLWWSRPRHREHPRRAAILELNIMIERLIVGQTTPISLVFKAPNGDVVQPEASNIPTWSIDQTALGTLTPSNDGLTANLTALAVGKVTITVNAEGDPTPGVDPIVGIGSVDIVEEASSLELVFGAPATEEPDTSSAKS